MRLESFLTPELDLSVVAGTLVPDSGSLAGTAVPDERRCPPDDQEGSSPARTLGEPRP